MFRFRNANKVLWGIIVIYIAIIYLTLPLMPIILVFFNETLGRNAVSLLVNSFLIFAVLSSFLFFFINSKKESGRLTMISVILISGTWVAMGYEIPEERIHFLEYGILGYLVLKAAVMNEWKTPVLSSIVFVTIVGAGDEVIQWFLPNRVGDLRDVFMNSFGGLLGIGIKRTCND